MSTVQVIKKISDIKGEMKVCDFCKQDLIYEYFNHFISPLKHKLNPLVEYEFAYRLNADGKCQMSNCNRDAFATIWKKESKYVR